ncbi:hypothetical protein [Flavobacterium sp.]|uniref:ImuA family protein n=1 Tax=Flavobacterium sp. TaxID=239 RepID=UPI0025C510D0|nr:hypothetical protein [Flavobacterium sp.]
MKKLQREINLLQGLGKPSSTIAKRQVGLFEDAFPDRVFPIGTVHEFLSYQAADAASTNGFITALASTFLNRDGICLWIGRNRKIYPPGLTYFGVKPERVIFIDLHKQQDLLWTIEEALKCDALTTVVGEIKELGFTESRRLQLAVERSGVTGFIHRYNPKSENSVACTTRWKITPVAGIAQDGLPGVGHSCWNVELLKVRNGRPGSWQIGWSADRFVPVADRDIEIAIEERQAG